MLPILIAIPGVCSPMQTPLQPVAVASGDSSGSLHRLTCSANKLLSGLHQIDWIGSWTDLLQSGDAYSQSIRSAFRESVARQPEGMGGPAISPEELEAFRRFIPGYGQ